MVLIMKRLYFLIVSCLMFGLFGVKVDAYNNSSYVLIDADSGRVMYEKNKDERFLTASICKILTCMVAIENGNLFESYKVSYRSSVSIGSSLYLEEDDEILLIDLLYGLMLRSGNDAATLISEVVFNDRKIFVKEMNILAKRIGMSNSTFENPTGLDDENFNYSTAYDMAILMKYAMENEVFYEISSSKSYRCKTLNNDYFWVNKHKLVQRHDYIISGKTGYTKRCGRTLVTYAIKDNMRLIAVSMNESDDYGLHKSLFEKASNEFSYEKIFDKGVLKQGIDFLEYYPELREDVGLLIKNNSSLKATIYLYKNPTNVCGFLQIYEDDNLIYHIPLYAFYPIS